jgi:hypothetical protein
MQWKVHLQILQLHGHALAAEAQPPPQNMQYTEIATYCFVSQHNSVSKRHERVRDHPPLGWPRP